MSITHKKNRNPLSNLQINCIFAKSASQILPIKGDCTFLFLNFLITGLCNFFPNPLLEIFSFLIVLPESDLSRVAKVSDHASKADFLSKNL